MFHQTEWLMQSCFVFASELQSNLETLAGIHLMLLDAIWCYLFDAIHSSSSPHCIRWWRCCFPNFMKIVYLKAFLRGQFVSCVCHTRNVVILTLQIVITKLCNCMCLSKRLSQWESQQDGHRYEKCTWTIWIDKHVEQLKLSHTIQLWQLWANKVQRKSIWVELDFQIRLSSSKVIWTKWIAMGHWQCPLSPDNVTGD